ncbi:hypothetical protein PENARI_c001G07678 [Penicillium arizonense]|uniref:Uncharacterized protein n=1 Tax=Penicillium arizonense TaxID=1835702 RepID=A0A1F5LYI2_PENAI|nr:hypothetical protein PENARI_c001G07678 [Penicillium arizonense]OGE58204.1 hypothetical protein PENARI_c001G07678 [Penicillium arizonense]
MSVTWGSRKNEGPHQSGPLWLPEIRRRATRNSPVKAAFSKARTTGQVDSGQPCATTLLPPRSSEVHAGNSIRPFRVDWAGSWSGTRADFVAPSDGLKNSVRSTAHARGLAGL